MRAYLLIIFESGIGDTYSTLVSAYETYLQLQSWGYETYLIFETRKNNYFNKKERLDFLFNLNKFENGVIYNIDWDINGSPDVVNVYKTIQLQQNQKSYRIFVSHKIPELEYYQSKIYGHPEIKHFSMYPNCYRQFLSDDVIEISNNFDIDKSNLVGIHYRPLDGHGDSNVEFEKIRNLLEQFVSGFQDKNMFVSSNGNLIRNYLKNNYKNIFTCNFSKQIEYYPCYTPHLKHLSEYDFIRHTQEIAAEMSIFRFCEKIVSLSVFLSNFITYGILNNIHSSKYENILQ